MRQTQAGVPLRVHLHRLDPGQNQPGDDRLVGVPADQQLLVRAGRRQQMLWLSDSFGLRTEALRSCPCSTARSQGTHEEVSGERDGTAPAIERVRLSGSVCPGPA
ncbi:hypothetical protein Ssi02_47120 [Sinosporangium siamense]|uniref:Uncharacterized protein n=1 Tax=Sinosporangium siamense TaxID=1367973 RepID=A0A919RLS8_9ACTN|nr:hypothetical protein Ssi02_47120 [Sinosporangium siamense]